MQQKYLISFSIILGAAVIGFFIYSAISYKPLLMKNNYPIVSTQNKSSVTQTTKCDANENTIVTKVIDGDTVVVEGGYHVRLLGIDADEKNYPCYDPAKLRLESLVLNKQIILERDKTDVDQYGRCLRTIFIGNPSAGLGQVQNIDLELIKEGLAVARFYQTDVKYKNEISIAEKQAIANKTGCKWSGVK